MQNVNVVAFQQTNNTVVVSATSTSSANAIGTSGEENPESGVSVRVYNAGGDMVYLVGGNSSAVSAAGTTGIPCPAGSSPEVIRFPPDTTHIAVRAASSTATVYLTPGKGV